ncbi:ribonuclease H-like domain-containing protein [Rhizophagus irregularis DAOM 181602=DAOM 197198]|nr:ribonuclease H-like domain-containing protein [Rhizophagus irregularis DAOM 181602=DAOM 197198]
MQSRGHYSATCSYCRQYWRQGRPQVLSAHLANYCKKCPNDVSLYFAKIVRKNLAKEEEESADEDESDYPNKRAELSRVNARVNNELEKESNFTIALDGWTDPRGNSLWAFILLTPSRKEYLLQLEDLSKNSHTAEYLSKVINDIICKVGISKIVAIVSDNAANVAGARRIITNEYPSIINIRCIAHCINLISSDIVKVDQVKCLVKRANILTRYFKNSTLASTWLKEAIDAKNIAGGGLKTYIETRWTTVHECTSSVYRLKDALLHVLDNHEREISNEAVKAILKKKGFLMTFVFYRIFWSR